MVYLFRRTEQDGVIVTEKISEFASALSWTSTFVEWQNGKYRAKQYCSRELGEYFTADPDGEPAEQEGSLDVDAILDFINGFETGDGEDV